MLIVGILSFVFYWVFVVHIFRKWGLDSFQTISDHVAIGDQRKFYNIRAMLLIGLFMLYVITYLLPSHHAGPVAYLLAATAGTGEFFVIYFPRFGRHFSLHDKLTSLVGSSMFVLTSLVVATAQLSDIVRVAMIFLLVVIGVVAVPIAVPRRKKNYIFLQSSFFGGLQIILLVLGIF